MDVSSCLSLAESLPDGQDVPMVVDSIVGVALESVETIVAAYSSRIDCTVLLWTQAGLSYAGQVTSLVLSEVSDPDGVLDLEPVEVDLSSCDEE